MRIPNDNIPLIVILFSFIFFLPSCSKVKEDIYETPQKLVPEYKNELRESVASLLVSAPLESFRNRLLNLTDKEYADSGSDTLTHQVRLKTKGIPSCSVRNWTLRCKDTWIIVDGPKLSGGYHYNVVAKRNGNIEVKGKNNKLDISIPIKVSGNAGLRGDGAKFLKLHKKNFEAELVAKLVVDFSIDRQWCPIINAEFSHKWTQTLRLEIIDGVYVNMGKTADDAVKNVKSEIEKQLAEVFSCEETRILIQKSWKRYIQEKKISDDETAFFIFDPTRAGVSDIIVGNDSLEMMIMVAGNASISFAEPPKANYELPVLESVSIADQKIKLDIPIYAEYSYIGEILSKTLFKKQEGSPPHKSWQDKFKITSLDVYPSNRQLVFKIGFEADLPYQIFDTSGIAYILGTPTFDSTEKTIALTEVEFMQNVDNSVWEFVQPILEGEVIQLINQSAVWELSSQVEEALANIDELINAKEEGVLGPISKLDGIDIQLKEQNLAVIVATSSATSINIPY